MEDILSNAVEYMEINNLCITTAQNFNAEMHREIPNVGNDPFAICDPRLHNRNSKIRVVASSRSEHLKLCMYINVCRLQKAHSAIMILKLYFYNTSSWHL